MNDNDNFANVQRLNSAVLAKYEWTSSRLGMQKTGEEVHDRRIRTYKKANEFLQDLLKKRGDGYSFDDNGTIDRYRKFLKHKGKIGNDGDDDILDEFNRRLRALHLYNKRRNELSKSSSCNLNESVAASSQTTSEFESHTEEFAEILNADAQSNRSTMVSQSSTINRSVLSDISFDDSQTESCFHTDEPQSSSMSSFEQSSSYSSTNTLHRPIARRADGTELVPDTLESSPASAKLNNVPYRRCYFPRSLLSHERMNKNITVKRELPMLPMKTYDNNRLCCILDRFEYEYSPNDLQTMLDQLTCTSIEERQTKDNRPLKHANTIERDDDILVIPNLFEQVSLSPNYYLISTFKISDPSKIRLYTMTIGIVQLNPSCFVPYSILNGRRPLLRRSIKTDFKRIRSQKQNHVCQVTAVDGLTNTESLKENDILLKVNDQSVYNLNINAVRNLLRQHNMNSNGCLLTIARLSQPYITL